MQGRGERLSVWIVHTQPTKSRPAGLLPESHQRSSVGGLFILNLLSSQECLQQRRGQLSAGSGVSRWLP